MTSYTESIQVADLSLAQLIQMSQGLGQQIEDLRAQRAYLKGKIDERLLAGESEHAVPENLSDGGARAPGAVVNLASGA